MKLRPLLACAAVLLVFCVSTVNAQLHWDINGAVAGAGGATPAGTWDAATANWNLDPQGDGDAGGGTIWTAGGDAVFSAGTDASGAFTVTLSGTQSANSILFQEGTVTLAGDQLNLTSSGSPADYNRDGIVNAADYVAWCKLSSLFGGGPGYAAWVTDFGASGGSGGTITTATGTTQTISSVIGGSVPLTKAGADRLLLTGANIYSGGTNISVGTLQFGNTTAMPASGAVTVANGATLSVNAGGGGEWTNAASGGGTIGGLISGTGGQGTLNQITWADGSNLGIDTTNAGGTLTYGNAIGGFRAAAGTTNAVGLTKRGAGTLLLTGVNTYTGRTTMTTDGGILKLGATNTLPAATVIRMPTVANSNTRVELFNDSGSGLTYYDQTVAGLLDGAGGTAATSGVVDVGFATLTLDVPTGQSYTYGGFLKTDYIDDPQLVQGRVIKEGDGEIILTLNQGNTFAGEFVLKEGRVGLGAGQAFGGTTSSTLRIEGGTFTKNNGVGALNVNPRTINIAGGFTFDLTGATSNVQFLPAIAGINFGGINLLVDNPTINVTIPDATSPTPSFILGRPISDGANSYGFTKTGNGTLTLNRPNAYNGATTIQEGVLRLAPLDAANPDGTIGDGNSQVYLAGGALEYNGVPSTGSTAPGDVNGARMLVVTNPIEVTAASSITYRTPVGNVNNHAGNIDFVFTSNSITGTGGTLTLLNDGTSIDTGDIVFRPTFTGSFSFGRPITISNHASITNRTTVLRSANTAGTETFSGNISGNGGVLRDGAGGETVLSGTNTYTGGTTILSGKLTTTHSSVLADNGDVFLPASGSGLLNLNFSGEDVIDQLFFNGIAQLTGTWGAPLSGADHTDPMFMGSGFLRVMASGASPGAVPEPGTLVLAVTAIFGLGANRRRRR